MRQYNRIYNEILKDENDFVGMVAYAIYKKHKISYIENFKSKNGGQSPSEDDLGNFHDSSCLNESINGYSNLAEKKIADFMADLYGHEVEEIKEDYNRKLDQIKQDFTNTIEEIRELKSPGFLKGVWQSTLGALGYTILIGFLLFTLWTLRFGIKHVIESITGYEFVKYEKIDSTAIRKGIKKTRQEPTDDSPGKERIVD